MDRFQWSSGGYLVGEHVITSQNGVRLYDGETKTNFDYGDLTLTSHRLEWKNPKDSICIGLSLSLVIYVEERTASIGKSPQVILHLHLPSQNQQPGPVQRSPNSYVKLAFKEGGKTNFYQCLYGALNRKLWEQLTSQTGPTKPSAVQTRAGIVGIERTLQERQKETTKSISKAFEDLNKLMEMARDMVSLSKTISTKIREKQGDISEDETIKFKSYLLSLGIDDPVTRGTHGTGASFHRELARELSSFIEPPLNEAGGVMALTDVYCRVNRARGFELLSPEDLLNACRMLEHLRLPVRLRVFDSGVMVLQLVSHNEEELVERTMKLLEDKGSLTAEELSQCVGLSVVLAKERLLATEKFGGACRDDSVEGLRFYPNWLLTRPSDDLSFVLDLKG